MNLTSKMMNDVLLLGRIIDRESDYYYDGNYALKSLKLMNDIKNDFENESFKENKTKQRGEPMNLNFIQGLTGNEEKTASSDNTMNYVAMKTPEGDITFTYDGDDRLEGVFKDYEKLGKITQAQHSELLNTINTCEWDLKLDFINGEFKKVEKYTPEEKNDILIERAKNEEKAFFNSEKRIALEIEEDYRLGLEEISDSQMTEVKQYMKSIQPKQSNSTMVLMMMPKIQRPAIMKYYEDKNNGVI